MDGAAMTTKRRLESTTFDNSFPPKKRARFTRTDIQHPDTSAFIDAVHQEPCSSSVKSFISRWLDSVGSDRVRRCRSESPPQHLHHNPVLRHLARSEPDMAQIRDADGFAVPPTPASTGSRSYRAGTDTTSGAPSDATGSGRSTGRRLVENSLYRDANLAENNIYMRPVREQFPEHIANLVDYMRTTRDSPGPSPDLVAQDFDLHALEMGAMEPDVEEFFRSNIFYRPKSTESLKRSDRQPISKHAVPNTGSRYRISNPVPDMVYGYDIHRSFTGAQRAQLNALQNSMVANSQNLIYPFLTIEFKGDGPNSGSSLWVATNQCLGGSASCVNIAEHLNHELRKCNIREIQPINSAAFSVAMSGTEARIYVSWKHNELDYHMRKVQSFLLQDPEHYIAFRKYVRNVLDWGRDKRLKEIQDSLDGLLEDSRKKAAEEAKSRPLHVSPCGSTAKGAGHHHVKEAANREDG